MSRLLRWSVDPFGVSTTKELGSSHFFGHLGNSPGTISMVLDTDVLSYMQGQLAICSLQLG